MYSISVADIVLGGAPVLGDASIAESGVSAYGRWNAKEQAMRKLMGNRSTIDAAGGPDRIPYSNRRWPHGRAPDPVMV